MMVAQGLEALAPSLGTAQATIHQVQGQSFVDSVVGASAGTTGRSAGGVVEFFDERERESMSVTCFLCYTYFRHIAYVVYM